MRMKKLGAVLLALALSVTLAFGVSAAKDLFGGAEVEVITKDTAMDPKTESAMIGTAVKMDQISGTAFHMKLSKLTVPADCFRWLLEVDVSKTPYVYIDFGEGSTAGVAVRTCKDDQTYNDETGQNLIYLVGSETLVGMQKADLRKIYGPNAGKIRIGISIWLSRQPDVPNDLYINGVYIAGEGATEASLKALPVGVQPDDNPTPDPDPDPGSQPEQPTEPAETTIAETETTVADASTTAATTAAATSGKTESTLSGSSSEADEGGSALPVIIAVIVIVVVAGGAAAAYFILKKKKTGPDAGGDGNDGSAQE